MALQGYLTTFPSDTAEEAVAKLGSDRVDELVKKCVHAIIVLGQERNPIKKTDLGRLVFSSVTNYRAVNGLIHKANKELLEVFGMRLYMIDDMQPKYFLVNTELDYTDFHEARSDEENEELTVLHFTLMEIFTSVDERSLYEDIEKSLKPLELKTISKDCLKSYLDRFVKQMYLKLKPHQDAQYYIWGPRAYAEFDLDVFFQRFLDLARDDNPDNWPDLKTRIANMKKLQKPVTR